MIFFKQILSGTKAGIFLSTLFHAGLGGGLYYTFTVEPPPRIVAEIDLSMTSLLPKPPAPPPPPGPGAPSAEATPGPTRTVAKKQAAASPLPQEETPPKPEMVAPPVVSETPSDVPEIPEVHQTPSTEEPPAVSGEVQDTEEGRATAGEVVSVDGTVSGEPGGVPGGISGGVREDILGGIPGGAGRYRSASEVAQLPRWVGNFIGPGDYPRKARRKGKDGQVLLSVFIDEIGRVRDVRLMQGADEALNEVALRKVREARFTPAYDEKGEPVACKVTLPIRFQLQ